jgi:hypothetical protein
VDKNFTMDSQNLIASVNCFDRNTCRIVFMWKTQMPE